MSNSTLIVEDHPLYGNALNQAMQMIAGDVSMLAKSAEEGLSLAKAHPQLQLVLIDPGLPGLSGAEAIAAFCQSCPQAAVAAISASESRHEVMAAFRAGARAFISKAVSTEILIQTIKRILAGDIREPEWIKPSANLPIRENALPSLSDRKKEILRLLIQGHPNKEIALQLGLAEVTVKLHVSSILKMLRVSNRTQAVLTARRLGIAG